MKCLSPVTIQNPNFGKWWLPNGHLSHIDVPCGKCYSCLSTRRLEWSYRCSVEALSCLRSVFITLTIDDEHLEDNVCKKSDLQLYFKRLRKAGLCFKYYAIGEYGTNTKRAHYHVLMFFYNQDYYTDSILVDTWKKGFVKIGTVSPSSINYVLHYHVRPKLVDGRPTFALSSKGIGLQQVNDSFLRYIKNREDFVVHTPEGNSYLFPRYYRKKYDLKKSYVPESVYDYIISTYKISDPEQLTRTIFSLVDNDKRKKNKYNYQEKL